MKLLQITEIGTGKTGIFLENYFKYQNAHKKEFGGAILANIWAFSLFHVYHCQFSGRGWPINNDLIAPFPCLRISLENCVWTGKNQGKHKEFEENKLSGDRAHTTNNYQNS